MECLPVDSSWVLGMTDMFWPLAVFKTTFSRSSRGNPEKQLSRVVIIAGVYFLI